MFTLGIIPARFGSKRLPRKNFLKIGGKTLVEWTIEQAAGAKLLDEYLVSTDDKRPPYLCQDDTPTLYVLAYHGASVPVVVCLQPNIWGRTSEDIDEAIAYYRQEGLDTLYSRGFGDRPDGSIWVISGELLRNGRMYGPKTGSLLSKNPIINIDTEFDFWQAEQAYERSGHS